MALLGWRVPAADLAMLLLCFSITAVVAAALWRFPPHRLRHGHAHHGDNDQMIRALGVNTDTMLISGLALSNGLVALSGSLQAQYHGFADVQMGIGSLVVALASIIMGKALVRRPEPHGPGRHRHRGGFAPLPAAGGPGAAPASTPTTSS